MWIYFTIITTAKIEDVFIAFAGRLTLGKIIHLAERLINMPRRVFREWGCILMIE